MSLKKIPKFPKFKKIDIDDKDLIESYTNKYKPYSDFNFTSMWSWDVKEERMVSELNKNLVVKFTDYNNSNSFLSFLGNNQSEETINEIIEYSRKNKKYTFIKLLPEESIEGISQDSFDIIEDRNNFDYIMSVDKISTFSEPKFKSKRKLASKFISNTPGARFETLNFNTINSHNAIYDVIKKWVNNKIKLNKESSLNNEEKKAVEKLLKTAKKHNLILSCINLENKTIAFGLDEILKNGKFAISHFCKADISYKGIYEFFNREIAKKLKSVGVKFWNWEQDLGYKSLRESKESYRPLYFLKKYKILINK